MAIKKLTASRLTLGIAAALTLGIAGHTFAEEKVLKLDVDSQTVGSALVQLSKRAGVQIVISQELGDSVTLSAIRGEYTLPQALDKMLDGSGLKYEFRSEGLIVVDRIEEDGNSEEPEKETIEVDEEVIVTGTLLRNVNPTSPTVIIDRQQIERFGASSAEDIMRRLSQNFPSLNSATSLGLSPDRTTDQAPLGLRPDRLIGNQAANLRGVGFDSTLILVNGRRVAGTAVIEGGFVNLSTIPAGAIERVEVLLDGASAIYGADAIAGVINFITRRDYAGAETGVRYENALNGGNRYTLSQTLGLNWDGGSAVMTLQGQVTGQVSNLKAGFVTRDFTSLGGPDFSFFRGASAPGTVSEVRNLLGGRIQRPGALIGALPAGTLVNDGSTDAGDFTLENASALSESRLQTQTTTSDNENYSFTANALQQVGALELYADLLYSATDNFTTQTDYAGSAISSTNFYNPFDRDVFVDYLAYELSPLTRDSNQQRFNITLGGKFDIAGDWQGDIALTWGEESSFFQSTGLRGQLSGPLRGFTGWITASGGIASGDDDNLDGIPDSAVDLNGDGVVDADDNMFSSSDPDIAFNPFGAPGSAQSPFFNDDLTEGFFSEDNSISRTLKMQLNGSVMRLPGGTAQLAVGAEYRETVLKSVVTNEGSLGFPVVGPGGPTDEPILATERGQTVTEFFGEISLPVVGDNNALPGVQSLLFTVAARHSSYDPDFINTTYSNASPKLGMRWDVTDEFVIRANWGESFRAPTVSQLAVSVSSIPIAIPFLNSRGITRSVLGGNPNVQPEVSTSTTIGFDWTPSAVEGLDINATYTDIDYRDRITGFVPFSPPDELEQILQVPGIVIPDPFNPGELAFFDGPVNSARRISRSVDVGIRYDFETDYGAFTAAVNGTRTLELSDQFFTGAELIDFTGTDGAPNQWMARANLSWNRDYYGADLFVNYQSSYTYRPQTFFGFCNLLNGCFNQDQRVEPYTTYDLTGYYNFDESGWRLLGGVLNLTNTGFPRVFDINGPWDASRVDLRGRIMYLEVKKRFDI